MSFTALATRAYKDPLTTVYLNSLKQNDDYLITAVSKAWVKFDGSAASVSAIASQNVSSITDSGAGLFTINFITGMIGSGYVMVGSVQEPQPGQVCVQSGTMGTGSCGIAVTQNSDVLIDEYTMVVFFGEGK